MPRCQHRIGQVPPSTLSRLLPKNHVCPTYSMTSMTPLAPTVVNAREAKRDIGRQHTVTPGLSHGRPQWIRRVRRSCASSEGFVSLVTASALGPRRLHDPTGLLCLAPLKYCLLQTPSWTTRARSAPCPADYCPDNDASTAAEPLLKTFLLGVHKLTTSSYSPRGNDGVERVYNTMTKVLAMFCNEHQHIWDEHLSFRCTQTYDKRLLPDW